MRDKFPCRDLINAEKKITRIDDKTDLLVDLLQRIDKETAINSRSLQEHMRRTDLLEQRISKDEERSYGLAVKLYSLVGALGVIQLLLVYFLTK